MSSTEYPQYRLRPATVEAVQFIHGVSTRTELLAFCPKANIGSPWDDSDDTDIRWFFVPCRGDGEVHDGDWILRATDGTFTVCREDDFARRYEHVEPQAVGGPITTNHGHVVTVREAEFTSFPCVVISVDDGETGLYPHLTRGQARTVRDQLDAWLTKTEHE